MMTLNYGAVLEISNLARSARPYKYRKVETPFDWLELLKDIADQLDEARANYFGEV